MSEETLTDKLKRAADEVILADKEGREPVLPEGIMGFVCSKKDMEVDLDK